MIVRRRWRIQAAAVIEELFARTAPAHWDMLLDLRGAILRGEDWESALDLFLRCKARMENDNYLPFYRLRRLLAASLRFESSGLNGVGEDAISLAKVLRQPYRSLAEARAALVRSSDVPDGPGAFRRSSPLSLQLREL
jgi:hypothetical protein